MASTRIKVKKSPARKSRRSGFVSWFDTLDPVLPEGKLSLTSQVTFTLREKIEHALYTTVLRAGDYLGSEKEFVDAFGLSRVPVRGALKALQAIGLVNIKVGKSGGIFVAESDPQSAVDAISTQIHLFGFTEVDIYEAQNALQNEIYLRAAKRRTKAELHKLREHLDVLGDLLDDNTAFVNHSVAFRLKVAEISGNPILTNQLRVLLSISLEHYWPYDTAKIGRTILKNHKKMVDLIEAKDAEGIVELSAKTQLLIKKARRLR